ncbi:carbon storage regulator [Rosistilla oblonga]|uniref:carbon storage regulator n=1 Tax=Rosistilla oblonga TaxID=2527990 RepID=UPI003A97F969
MLVLTRKAKQQIRLGDDIIVTVLQVKGNSIRLGIEAPRETRVVRGELEFYEEQPKSEGASGSRKQPEAAAVEAKPVAAKPTTAAGRSSVRGASKSNAAAVQVLGPTKLKIQQNSAVATRFPRTAERGQTVVSEVSPLKRFMPKSMVEAVGNVSV